MRRIVAVVGVVVWAASAGAPAAGDPSFTRTANTEAGRLVFESGEVTVDVLSGDAWQVIGQDALPFDYEQGVAFTGDDGLVFSSRGALMRTTLGCPDPLDDDVPCYDEDVERPFGISAAEAQRGFNHIGDIDVGLAGPADGFVFAPLETSTGGGACPRTTRGYKAYRASDLTTAGVLIEDACHRFHSWVSVDPSGRYLLTAEDGEGSAPFSQTIRVLEIAGGGPGGTDTEISITPQPTPPEPTLDIEVTPAATAALPNYAGCSFLSAQALYCSDWRDSNEIDVVTRIFRIDLTAPVGESGVTGVATQILNVELEPKLTGVDADGDGDGEPIVPFGNETEGITFYAREPGGPVEMHVLFRGETLGSFYFLHLAPVP